MENHDPVVGVACEDGHAWIVGEKLEFGFRVDRIRPSGEVGIRIGISGGVRRSGREEVFPGGREHHG